MSGVITFSFFWIVGLVITSFTVLPVMIMFLFGIPTTYKLEKLGVLIKNNKIIERELISMAVLLIVFFVVFFLVKIVSPYGLIGVLFGASVSLISGFGQTGKNEMNIRDYIETNKRFFTCTPEVIRYIILR